MGAAVLAFGSVASAERDDLHYDRGDGASTGLYVTAPVTRAPLSSAVLLPLPVDTQSLIALTRTSGAENSIDREGDSQPLSRELSWVAKGVPIDGSSDGRGLRVAPWFSGQGVKLKGYF